jgi:hypothetical protein
LALGLFILAAFLPQVVPAATGTWTKTGSLATHRSRHTATLLTNGKVPVTGGNSSNCAEVAMTDFPKNSYMASAELYDPAVGTWFETGPLFSDFLDRGNRYEDTDTLLTNGKVLMLGGQPTTVDIMRPTLRPILPPKADQRDKSK